MRDPLPAGEPHPAPVAGTEPSPPVATGVRWLLVVVALASAIGTAVALFLWSLDQVTAARQATPALLWCLPMAGALVSVLYLRAGGNAERGTNLVLDEIHAPGGGVPGRMAPLVLLGTLVTHLFGGSAGREGTAVQMGGSIAGVLERRVLRRFRITRIVRGESRSMLLQAGIAAGFGAVFGTPFAGAVFALEVLRVGRLTNALTAVLPCLGAALLADRVTLAWGIRHAAYPQLSASAPWSGGQLLWKVAAAAVIFGLVSRLFARSSHFVAATLAQRVRPVWARPVLGGLVVIALTYAVGSRDYLGLGVTSPDAGAVTIVSAFRDGGAERWSWLLKLVFTVVTIGSGFKGGEVTPLFFIGATLGHTLALWLGAPIELFAALGFVAVFAGATNTPVACTLLGLELFGVGALPWLALASVIAFAVSGPIGVYAAQRPRREPSGTQAAPDA